MLRFPIISGPSVISGIGAFTSEAIPRRAKIGEVTGAIISSQAAERRAAGARSICLVYLNDTDVLDCSCGNVLKHLNHSCDANAFLRIFNDRVEVYARRDIQAGEELTVDYGETPHQGGMNCRCGAPGCRGKL